MLASRVVGSVRNDAGLVGEIRVPVAADRVLLMRVRVELLTWHAHHLAAGEAWADCRLCCSDHAAGRPLPLLTPLED